ncbi:hypothetical protein M3576_17175 [Weizmannia ginsengihumi]|nr:hypothetical protein [Heyndrickxia ginsengihumi]
MVISKTDETLLVKVLLVKVIIDDANKLQYVKSHSDIRKAMFENKLLVQRIAEYMDDETIMEEFVKDINQSE